MGALKSVSLCMKHVSRTALLGRFALGSWHATPLSILLWSSSVWQALPWCTAVQQKLKKVVAAGLLKNVLPLV
jgi:hypothetical protein